MYLEDQAAAAVPEPAAASWRLALWPAQLQRQAAVLGVLLLGAFVATSTWYALSQVSSGSLRGRLVQGALVLALVAIAAAALSFYQFLRKPLRAIREAAAFARDLDAHRGARLPIYTGAEEITELGRALNQVSQRLAEQTQELEAKNEHLHAILSAMTDGIVTTDEDGVIETANAAALRIFGYGEAQARGRRIDRLIPDFPFGGPAREGAAGLRLECEMMGRRSDGALFPLMLGLSAMRFSGRRRLVVTVRDVTERKRLERVKDRLIATMSHELRTPLTSVQGCLDLMAVGAFGNLSDEAKGLLNMARKNSDRLASVLNNMADVERIEGGALPFNLRPIEVLPFLHDALNAHQFLMHEYKIQLVLHAVVAGVKVMADPERLMQALTQLLHNAAKFSPPNAEVALEVTRRSGQVRIAVIDHGPGLLPELRARLFQKFEADTEAKGSGAGLGLAIAYAIVRRLGGKLDVVSRPHVETAFFIELPEVH